MKSQIEKIKAKSASITESRSRFLDRLLDLQKAIADSLNGIDIYAETPHEILAGVDPDNSIYGYLYYSNGQLQVAYRSSDDDYQDVVNNIPEDERSYKIKDIATCPVEWLEKLSSESNVNYLLTKIDAELDEVDGMSKHSLSSIEKILESQSQIISDDVTKALKEMDENNLLRDWNKARQQISLDPADSITRSSSYLESVCRKVLSDLSVPLPSNKEISSLIKSTMDALGISENSELNDDLKQLYGSVKGIFKSVGTLRTHFGSAHGSGPDDTSINESHARLASDVSAAASIFLLNKLKEKRSE